MKRSTYQSRAALELTFASALWGFGFVAAVWALRGMGPLSNTGWRFFVASLIGSLIVAAVPSLRRDCTREQFRLAAIPGLLLMALILLQTWGLRYTTAMKCGFITILYVIIVPLLEWWWLKRRPTRLHFFCVAVGLFGVILIADAPGELTGAIAVTPEELARQRFNIGDVLTFLCAIGASVHMVWFGLIQTRIKSSFVFNNFQSIWAAPVPLLLSFVIEPMPRLSVGDLSIFGFLSLAICSTLIAFALQVRAQKVISPSLASLLFLLESPFATFFAYFLLGERLQNSQWVGAGLILVAAGVSTAFAKES